ncbi:MAG: hypothetical protein KDE32_06525 [Novosphingobium sp.]|nr:hypothetical protein [Novosphingobium sp.]
MERFGEETHVTTTEASGGVKNHGVRYVLMFSLLIAIAVLSLVWITGAWHSKADDVERPYRIQGAGAETG